MIPIGSGRGIENIEGHTDYDIVWPWHSRAGCGAARPPCSG